MNMKTKPLRIRTMVCAALLLTLLAVQARVETAQASNGGQATHIKVNGQSAVSTSMMVPGTYC
jgi:hypothetical protein